MSKESANPSDLGKDSIEQIRKSYSTIKTLQEEKKSISEDIREEKLDCSKKTGLSVKDINGIMKMLHSRESGEYSDDYVRISKQIEGITAPGNAKTETKS